jgi:hypothetical protein
MMRNDARPEVGSRMVVERVYVTKWLPPILVRPTEIKIEKS